MPEYPPPVHILGIDIGGSGIKGAPVDTDSGALCAPRHRLPTPDAATPAAVAAEVARIVQHFDWTGPVGCTLPSVVQHGVVRTAANIHPDWVDTRVEELFGAATGLPVHVLNDADAAGLASVGFGSAKGRDGVVLFLTIGTGIGSALIVDQRLVPNTELGHLEFRGMAAEEYCSSRARKRDGLTWRKWANRLQRYLDHLERLFSPDLIVLGGGVSRPDKVERYFDELDTNAELVPAALQNEAGIIGAAWAARQALVQT